MEFIHRGFLFASASPFGAETDLPEANETKTSGPLTCVTLPKPCKGPESQLPMFICFCKICKNKIFYVPFLKDGPNCISFRLWPCQGTHDHMRLL